MPVQIPEEAGKRLTGYYRLATADGKRYVCLKVALATGEIEEFTDTSPLG